MLAAGEVQVERAMSYFRGLRREAVAGWNYVCALSIVGWGSPVPERQRWAAVLADRSGSLRIWGYVDDRVIIEAPSSTSGSSAAAHALPLRASLRADSPTRSAPVGTAGSQPGSAPQL